MKKMVSSCVMAVIGLVLALAGPAEATIQYDQDVKPNVIFGDGNANGSFTIEQAGGIELGLRGKLRFDATGQPADIFNSNGDGTYSFQAIVAPTKPSPTAEWSFEWSINSNFDGHGGSLDSHTYTLGIDSDPTAGVSFLSFDPINGVNGATGAVQWDHAIGDNTTGEGGGTSIPNTASDTAGYAALIANNNVAQNSWQAHWLMPPDFDPTVNGTYDIFLAAFQDGNEEIARTSIQIIVGEGAAVVPEPTSVVIWSLLGTVCMGAAMRRRRRNA